jgi:hypothetical protein
MKQVARENLGWKLTYKEEDDWDICWSDVGLQPDRVNRLKGFQKINHFHGIPNLTFIRHVLNRKEK